MVNFHNCGIKQCIAYSLLHCYQVRSIPAAPQAEHLA